MNKPCYVNEETNETVHRGGCGECKTFTPGPWFAGTGWVGHGEVKDGRVIARMDHYPYGNSEADILLIAAAPEMFASMSEAIVALRVVAIVCDIREQNETAAVLKGMAKEFDEIVKKARGNV